MNGKKRVKGGQQFSPLSSVFYLDMTMGLISHENEGLSQEGALKRVFFPNSAGDVTKTKEGKYNPLWRNRAPEKTETRKTECHSVIVKDEWDDFRTL
ncbi:hypothetical protein CEXT_462661 [Caerostris extrusa]|uniref:Uncharacterized protein n=1 Tax=Caerostris extrusa TaxID=172846 RepID=A0AAV4YCK4_CAEEX|nr:hypothetical protein CEXT_462661 [Caerostris extrusa]